MNPSLIRDRYNMLLAPSSEVTERFSRFATATTSEELETPLRLADGRRGPMLPCFRFGSRLVILAAAENTTEPRRLAAWISQNPPAAFEDQTAYEVIVAVANLYGHDDVVVGRGVRLTSIHGAVASVVELPSGWRDTQSAWLSITLEPLRIDGEFRLAPLHATNEHGATDADHLVREWLTGWGAARSAVLYLRAEAGKGKSTLLANGVRQALEAGAGPLPMYLPLRTLQRGVGVAWSDIAAQLGVLGTAAESLRAAVRSGLIALALDGLDEVAGRYDPVIVQGVVSIVADELLTDVSNVALSGRTTEAGLLSAARTHISGD